MTLDLIKDTGSEFTEVSGQKIIDRWALVFDTKNNYLKWTDRQDPMGIFEVPDPESEEYEIDLTGVGGGKPILYLKENGEFGMVKTVEGEVTYLPEDSVKVVDLRKEDEWKITTLVLGYYEIIVPSI